VIDQSCVALRRKDSGRAPAVPGAVKSILLLT
jgi:hypothetical protein